MTKKTTPRIARRRAARRSTFRRTTKPIDPRNRLLGLSVVFAMIGAGFIAQLVDLQAVRPDSFRDYGENQRTRTRQLDAYRGQIVDRNGFVFASSTPSHQIVADPSLVKNPGATASVLAPILGMELVELTNLLTPESEGDQYSLLARTVSDESAEAIVAWGDDAPKGDTTLQGVYVRPEEDRIYPSGSLALSIVGRVDPDKVGIYGVEQIHNDVMTGRPGKEQIERGRFGSISVGDRVVDPASEGYDVILTIDNRIQYVTEQALLDHCKETGANRLTAVISDPMTGEILTMASVVRTEDGCEIPIYNNALVSTFEPGSVLKTFTMAAAVEELNFNGTTLVDVPPRVTIGGKTFVDRPGHPGAPYPVSQILSDSMNVGTIQVAQQLGPTNVYKYLDRFGFGHHSQLGFDGESTGTVREPGDWYGSDAGSIPIGQGVTVNTLQLVGAYNVIANGGTYYPPTLVKAVRSPGGNVHRVESKPSWPVVLASTSATITEMLVGVVNEGTGTAAAIPGYQVAGKTGTAWKVFDDGSGTLGYGSDDDRRYVVTFAGFVPAENPQLTMAIVVDEPKSADTASAIAAPVFSEIGQYALRILSIAPDGSYPQTGSLVTGTPAEALDQEQLDGDQLDEQAATAVDRSDQ